MRRVYIQIESATIYQQSLLNIDAIKCGSCNSIDACFLLEELQYCIQHSVLSQHIEQPRYIGYGKQGEHRAPTNGSTGQQEERFTETSSFTLEPMILYANSSVQEWTLLARRLAQGSAPVLAHNPMQQHCQCSFQSLQYDKRLPRHHPLIPQSCILHCMAWCVKGLG